MLVSSGQKTSLHITCEYSRRSFALCIRIDDPRYLFGGIGSDGAGLGDLYVLSLPSFQWTLVSTFEFDSAHTLNSLRSGQRPNGLHFQVVEGGLHAIYSAVTK